MRVFISYRRATTTLDALRLAKIFRKHLPHAVVFVDVEGIDPGEEFPNRLRNEVSGCDVFIALADARYFSVRLNDPADFVRIELGIALERVRHVIPLLLDGAEVPDAGVLPAELKALPKRHRWALRRSRFRRDAMNLVRRIESLYPGRPAVRLPVSVPTVALATMALAAVFALRLSRPTTVSPSSLRRPPGEASASTASPILSPPAKITPLPASGLAPKKPSPPTVRPASMAANTPARKVQHRTSLGSVAGTTRLATTPSLAIPRPDSPMIAAPVTVTPVPLAPPRTTMSLAMATPGPSPQSSSERTPATKEPPAAQVAPDSEQSGRDDWRNDRKVEQEEKCRWAKIMGEDKFHRNCI